MVKKIALYLTVVFYLAACSTLHMKADGGSEVNEGATSALYTMMLTANNGDPDVAMLNLFFTRMPKGGDIHHHYSGSIYAETYLDWIKKKGWFIDACSLKIVKVSERGKCQALTVDALRGNDVLYRKLLTLWSDKDYANHFHEQPPPDTNFFNTFGYFGPVSDEYMDVGLNVLKQRAIKENISYIETMLTRVGASSSAVFKQNESDRFNAILEQTTDLNELTALFNQIAARLEASKVYKKHVKDFVEKVEKVHQGIDDERFTMRYQTYAVRTLPPLQVFTDLYAGFQAANDSPLVVGVNIVAPENNHVALINYTLHMRMFAYLHRLYPQVNRALHAGELTLGMVRPRDLLFHITEARQIADAQRIGHGVDLTYEQDQLALLKDMKTNSTVEINLTSNQFILGVQGSEHPYQIYADYGVPLVISTDDSGVSRNNLSHEYMLLASRYKPSYEQIKSYVYNSIKYSFMSDKDKAMVTKRVNQRFAVFEGEMAVLGGSLQKKLGPGLQKGQQR